MLEVGMNTAKHSIAYIHTYIHVFYFESYKINSIQFKVDRLQIIVVAKKYIYVSQLFISRMPKMRAIPQLVSAPLNPIPIAEHQAIVYQATSNCISTIPK